MEYGRTVIRKEGFTLYLVKSDSEEAPGITVFAQVDIVTPKWDWEEFRNWSADKRALVFGTYYDKRYPSLNFSYQSGCRLSVERFDHRESAQEVAYGQWLHNIEPEKDAFYDYPKGLLITIPIRECESSLAQPKSKPLLLTIIVADRLGTELEPIEIQLQVGKVGTWLVVWGRSFEIG